MRADIIRPAELDADHVALWRSFVAATPSLQSPFFAPEFTQAVGESRRDARVAVLRQDGVLVGFLPFHQLPGRLAKPIGGPICDYQGVIHAPGVTLDGRDMLRAARLRAYDFNHAPADQTALAGGAFATAASPAMALDGGFDAYLGRLDKAGRHSVKETERRIRKMSREIGEVRFVLNDADPRAWPALLAMKSESFERKGSRSIFDVPWVAATLERLRATESESLTGLLSTVYAGDRIVAAHFGMRSASVWNWWFNTYDFELRNLAPGLITILEAARRAPALGLRAIDFGRGEQYYKKAFATGATALIEGSIERPNTVAGLLRKGQKFALGLATEQRLGERHALLKRAIRKLVRGGVHLPRET